MASILDVLFEQAARWLLARAKITVNGSKPWDPQITDRTLSRRVFLGNASLVLGEAYMSGGWTCEALDEFTARIVGGAEKGALAAFRRLKHNFAIKAKKGQTKSGARTAVAHHYDIGPELYELMLRTDPYRQYSCGYWNWGARDLAESQVHKMKKLCEMLQLHHGMSVLDVGGGFGGLAKFMAEEYGAHVTMITLSEDQCVYARDKMCTNLRRGSVEVLLLDYRDIRKQDKNTFDRIVSVGMFEHVGVNFYGVFMRAMYRCLASGGIFVLHTIGGRGQPDPWIDKYIFPDGTLPTRIQIENAIFGLFNAWDWHEIGKNYAPTLRAWYDNFHDGWPEIRGSKYDEVFYRMWRYYLLVCSGLFKAGRTDVWQIVLSKHGRPADYQQIR